MDLRHIEDAVHEAIVENDRDEKTVRAVFERALGSAIAVRLSLCEECDGSLVEHMDDCPTLTEPAQGPATQIDGLAIPFEQLAELVRAQAPLGDSRDHGDVHWRAVAATALDLAEREEGIDARIVLLFALLHDSRRQNEMDDPDHGRAAELFMERLSHAGLLDDSFGADDEERLGEAVRLHDEGEVTDDPTIGACWDADRLQLQRYAITPLPALLSLGLSCNKRFQSRAADYDKQTPTWTDLAERAVRLAAAAA